MGDNHSKLLSDLPGYMTIGYMARQSLIKAGLKTYADLSALDNVYDHMLGVQGCGMATSSRIKEWDRNLRTQRLGPAHVASGYTCTCLWVFEAVEPEERVTLALDVVLPCPPFPGLLIDYGGSGRWGGGPFVVREVEYVLATGKLYLTRKEAGGAAWKARVRERIRYGWCRWSRED